MENKKLSSLCLNIQDITLLESYENVIKKAYIKSFLKEKTLSIGFMREDILDPEIKQNIEIDSLRSRNIAFFVSDAQLDLDGRIIDCKYLGDRQYEIYVELSDSFPQYFIDSLKEMICFH